MRTRGSISGPLVLIFVGIRLLGITAVTQIFELPICIARYWPYALILWGVFALFEVCIRFIRQRSDSAQRRFRRRLGCWLSSWRSSVRPLSNSNGPTIGFVRLVLKAASKRSAKNINIPIETISRSAGAAPHIMFEDFRGDAKISGTDATTVTVTGQKTIGSFDRPGCR